MDTILFWRLRQAEGNLVAEDEKYKYYTLTFMAHNLMYAKNRFRDDGQKMFLMCDEFAKVLGFWDYEEMRKIIKGCQYWRGFLTLRAIERHLR